MLFIRTSLLTDQSGSDDHQFIIYSPQYISLTEVIINLLLIFILLLSYIWVFESRPIHEPPPYHIHQLQFDRVILKHNH